jgi:hypothetical protein
MPILSNKITKPRPWKNNQKLPPMVLGGFIGALKNSQGLPASRQSNLNPRENIKINQI